MTEQSIYQQYQEAEAALKQLIEDYSKLLERCNQLEEELRRYEEK